MRKGGKSTRKPNQGNQLSFIFTPKNTYREKIIGKSNKNSDLIWMVKIKEKIAKKCIFKDFSLKYIIKNKRVNRAKKREGTFGSAVPDQVTCIGVKHNKKEAHKPMLSFLNDK